MTDDPRYDRRGFLSLVGVAALAGCSDSLPTVGPTPTSTPTVALFEAHPETLVLTRGELPSGATWEQSPSNRRDDTFSVGYEVFVDGDRSHQISLGLSRRTSVDGAVFDHDNLVELYREEDDATATALQYGDEGTLVTFGDEAHAIVTYRNLSLNVGLYDDGPLESLRDVTELQVEKLERLAP
ncbi:hypothetical protein EGH21_04385 [Halomicroarcula sp. F13]|uniref:Twin-arginine translocation signal domain-containing protein n=1 Tax=Haloarcula rubra TaxID=2487747 RepID=A0AAW4PNK1_9EURY|nr:hypothetical protein [Halomicroarcula rubra]MBX0322269.1 hypothetical protein [Halomicroarcula rubra]